MVRDTQASHWFLRTSAQVTKFSPLSVSFLFVQCNVTVYLELMYVFWAGLTNRDCSKLLASLHAMATRSKLQGVYSKYSNSEHGAVALLPPAKVLLAGAGTPSTSTSITSIGAAAAKARVV